MSASSGRSKRRFESLRDTSQLRSYCDFTAQALAVSKSHFGASSGSAQQAGGSGVGHRRNVTHQPTSDAASRAFAFAKTATPPDQGSALGLATLEGEYAWEQGSARQSASARSLSSRPASAPEGLRHASSARGGGFAAAGAGASAGAGGGGGASGSGGGSSSGGGGGGGNSDDGLGRPSGPRGGRFESMQGLTLSGIAGGADDEAIDDEDLAEFYPWCTPLGRWRHWRLQGCLPLLIALVLTVDMLKQYVYLNAQARDAAERRQAPLALVLSFSVALALMLLLWGAGFWALRAAEGVAGGAGGGGSPATELEDLSSWVRRDSAAAAAAAAADARANAMAVQRGVLPLTAHSGSSSSSSSMGMGMAAVSERAHAAAYELRAERFYVACGLLVNVAELSSGYLGIGDSSNVVLVFFVYAAGRLPPRRAARTVIIVLLSYVLLALPWLVDPALPTEKFTGWHRIKLTLGAVLFGAVLHLSCSLHGQLQQESVTLGRAQRRFVGELRTSSSVSENLLLNIFPKEIIQPFVDRFYGEMKARDSAMAAGRSQGSARYAAVDESMEHAEIAESFPHCTVCFAHVHGLQRATLGLLNTIEEVNLMNHLVCRLDRLAEEHGVEKIKTIGDTYMCAAGVPRASRQHAARCANFALAAARCATAFGEEYELDLSYKIGLASGSVVAGVVGFTKFSYDIWGDTVNTASRMYSHAEAGMIQVTGETAALLSRTHVLEVRGDIEVKGKGRMRTMKLVAAKAANSMNKVGKVMGCAMDGRYQQEQEADPRMAQPQQPQQRPHGPPSMSPNRKKKYSSEDMSRQASSIRGVVSDSIHSHAGAWIHSRGESLTESGGLYGGSRGGFGSGRGIYDGGSGGDSAASGNRLRALGGDSASGHDVLAGSGGSAASSTTPTSWHDAAAVLEGAERLFEQPYAAAWNHFVTPGGGVAGHGGSVPGVARAMEKAFQKARKLRTQSFLQLFWLSLLAVISLESQLMELTGFDVDKAVSAGEAEARRQLARVLLNCVIIPLILSFVLVVSNTTLAVKHHLSPITFGFQLAIGLALVAFSAFCSRSNGSYFILGFVYACTNFSILDHATGAVLVALLVAATVATHALSERVDTWEGEYWALSFVFEKLLPVTLVSLACDYTTEVNYRRIFLRTRAIARQKVELEEERRVTEELLSSTLPPQMMAALKEGRQPALRAVGSVLFCDIVSFTVFAGSVDARRLVGILNRMFVFFDLLAEKHGIEKVKTLGDCYVASAGILAPSADHAEATCKMACGMHQAMARLNAIFGLALQVRIGVHSGDVVGGVIGLKKFTFDLWGANVDVANAMESEGVPGRVNVSDAAAEQVARSMDLELEQREETATVGGETYGMHLISEACQATASFGDISGVEPWQRKDSTAGGRRKASARKGSDENDIDGGSRSVELLPRNESMLRLTTLHGSSEKDTRAALATGAAARGPRASAFSHGNPLFDETRQQQPENIIA